MVGFKRCAFGFFTMFLLQVFIWLLTFSCISIKLRATQLTLTLHSHTEKFLHHLSTLLWYYCQHHWHGIRHMFQDWMIHVIRISDLYHLFALLHSLNYIHFCFHCYCLVLSSPSYITAAFVLASEHPGLEIKILHHWTLYSTLQSSTQSTGTWKGCMHVTAYSRHVNQLTWLDTWMHVHICENSQLVCREHTVFYRCQLGQADWFIPLLLFCLHVFYYLWRE